MKRLTKRNFESDFCQECPDYGEPCGCNRTTGPCDAYDFCQEAWDRLAAYEDTGLTPDEVAKLNTENAALRAKLQKSEAQCATLRKERNIYERAFEEVCRQFNFGGEKDYKDMRGSFLRLVKESTQ